MEAIPLSNAALIVVLAAKAWGSDTVIGNDPVIVDVAVPSNVVVETS